MRKWTWRLPPPRPTYLHHTQAGGFVGKLSSKLKMPYNAIYLRSNRFISCLWVANPYSVFEAFRTQIKLTYIYEWIYRLFFMRTYSHIYTIIPLFSDYRGCGKKSLI